MGQLRGSIREGLSPFEGLVRNLTQTRMGQLGGAMVSMSLTVSNDVCVCNLGSMSPVCPALKHTGSVHDSWPARHRAGPGHTVLARGRHSSIDHWFVSAIRKTLLVVESLHNQI